jgi:HK97 family phage portal protein
MNILRSLTSFVQRAATTEAAALALKFFYPGFTSYTRVPGKLELAFRGWAYACITKRSREIGKKRFIVYRKTGQNQREELPHDHWAARLLFSPNPVFTRTQIFRLIEEWFLVAGNAYIYAPKNGAKFPVQFWILPANRVQVVMSDNPLQLVKGYVYRSAMGDFPLDDDEVIHLQDLHPGMRDDSIIMGRGALEAALDVLEVSSMTREFLKQRIKTQNLPPLVLRTKGRVDAETWKNFKARMQENMPGISIVAALEQEGELVPLTQSGTESSYLRNSYQTQGNTSNEMVQELAAVFGIPPGLVTGEFQNRATSETLVASFYEGTIDPQSDYYAEEITRHLARFDPNIEVLHEKYVYQDPDQALRKQAQELQWGITTINEERKKIGLEPIVGGDTPFVPTGFVPLTQALNPPSLSAAPAPQPTPQEPAKTLLLKSAETDDDPFNSEDYCRKYWKSYDVIAERYTAVFNRTLQGLFDDLETEVVSNVDKEASKALRSGQRLERGTFTLFDVATWKERFAGAMTGDMEDYVQEAMQQAAQDIGEKWDDIKGEFEASIRAAVRESTDRITSSVDTVKDELQRLLDDMYDKPIEEIVAAIQRQFSHYSSARARLIARTTATAALTFSQMTVFDKMGYTYTWLSQRDGKTRPTHKVADMQEPDKEGYFHVGSDRMKYPGGGSQAKENAHCRCVLRPKKK